MSAFDTAMQALFADGNMAVTATYVPVAGGSKLVRVVTRAPDLYQNIGQSVVQTPSLVLEVQVTDCPSLSSGDVFIINAVNYTVQGVPLRDELRLAWKADVYAS